MRIFGLFRDKVWICLKHNGKGLLKGGHLWLTECVLARWKSLLAKNISWARGGFSAGPSRPIKLARLSSGDLQVLGRQVWPILLPTEPGPVSSASVLLPQG